MPTLVIRASGSGFFAAETMDKVRSTIPRAEVVELEGGHDLAHDNPAALAALVRKFLDKTD